MEYNAEAVPVEEDFAEQASTKDITPVELFWMLTLAGIFGLLTMPGCGGRYRAIPLRSLPHVCLCGQERGQSDPVVVATRSSSS